MGLMCWLNGHDYEMTEDWAGNAFDCMSVSIRKYRCERCGHEKKKVYVSGKLTNKTAETIVSASSEFLLTDKADGKDSLVLKSPTVTVSPVPSVKAKRGTSSSSKKAPAKVLVATDKAA